MSSAAPAAIQRGMFATHLPTCVPWYAAEAGQVCIAVGPYEHIQCDLPAARLPCIALEEGVLRVAQLGLPLCVVKAQVVTAGLEASGSQGGQASLEQEQLATKVTHHKVGGLVRPPPPPPAAAAAAAAQVWAHDNASNPETTMLMNYTQALSGHDLTSQLSRGSS